AMRWEATPRSIARSATPSIFHSSTRVIGRSIGNSWLDALLAQTICACPGPLVTHLRLRVGAVLAWAGSPGQAQATEVTCAGGKGEWTDTLACPGLECRWVVRTHLGTVPRPEHAAPSRCAEPLS